MILKLERTPRGFMRADFDDAYGQECSIQESSAMSVGDLEGPFLWLGMNDPDLQRFPEQGEGWEPVRLPDDVHAFARMHLTRAQVRALLPLLEQFVATGRLAQRGDG